MYARESKTPLGRSLAWETSNISRISRATSAAAVTPGDHSLRVTAPSEILPSHVLGDNHQLLTLTSKLVTVKTCFSDPEPLFVTPFFEPFHLLGIYFKAQTPWHGTAVGPRAAGSALLHHLSLLHISTYALKEWTSLGTKLAVTFS